MPKLSTTSYSSSLVSVIATLGTVGLGIFGCNTTSDASDSSAQGETARAAVCSEAEQQAAFARMIEQPIQPPRLFGGIDLTGGTWQGLTIDDAQKTLCQGQDAGEVDGDTTVVWGSGDQAGALTVQYNTASRKIDFVQMGQGYKGTLDFKSRPDDAIGRNPFGQHTYSIGVGRSILRDGAPWEIQWSSPAFRKQATELYDAIMATFAPELQREQNDCVAAQVCLARAMEKGEGVFGVRPLGIYFHAPASGASASTPSSTPDYLYAFFVRMLASSKPDTFLALDGDGPVAKALDLGDRRTNCVMKFGQTFQSYLDECVEVLRDPTQDDYQKQKALGTVHKSTDGSTWILGTQGVSPSFTVTSAGQTTPAADAVLNELTLDVRASGKYLNEYSRDGATLTMGATAAIYREYARVVQNALHAAMPADMPKFPIGAPECVAANPAHGCTGVESFITPAQPDTGNAGIDLVSVGPSKARGLGISTVVRPGAVTAAFCSDPATLEQCTIGALFKTTADRVTSLLGDATPADARTPNFYVKLFTQAAVKYLRAASQYPTDLSKPELAGLEPAASDITLEDHGGGFETVHYKDSFRFDVLSDAGEVTSITFRH